MAEDGNIKKRLRSTNTPDKAQPDQVLSSSKKKCTGHLKDVESECTTKPEVTPPRRSLRLQDSDRLSADLCTDVSFLSQKHDVNPSPQTIKKPLNSSTEDPKSSQVRSSKRQPKKSPQSRSKSWRRSSFKGGKGRKSLPPIQRDVTEICEDISMDLPGDERLTELFRACLEYTLQKLQHPLEQQEGFNLQAFKTDACGISKDLQRIIEAMKLDGTLRKCTEEPEDVPPTPETETLMKQLKNDISRLNAECESWNQLLETYQQEADRATNELEQGKVTGATLEPTPEMENSQMDVIGSKPDYQHLLDQNVVTLQSMECMGKWTLPLCITETVQPS
ncbi:kinetochore-associated protein DSN1 homolog isoform X2 [Rhinoraja longicauda]